MPDIRSFFAPKGGATPAKPAPKPAAKKEEEPKKTRGRARKVVEDSDDDDDVVEVKKPATKATPKKKKADEPVKGVEISASDYFASSSKAKPSSTPAKSQPKADLAVRASPRLKQPATKPAPAPSPAKPARAAATKRVTTANQGYDDDDNDDAEDIFAADTKSLKKRKNDDYAEDDSDDEDLPPKPKRVASRATKVKDDSDDDDVKPTPKSTRATKSTAAGTKRKSVPDSDEDEDDEPAPKKKAPAKPRAPRAKKGPVVEDPAIQAILDNVPTIDAPDAPPASDVKFDWKMKAGGAGGGGGNGPMGGAADVPEGAENCLLGKSFVFTGQLKTISREEGSALVKRYGGKVVGAPSSKTDFVVLGDDAGPSKLRKIQEHGIKTIDEEGLFYLIRSLPGEGGSGAGAQKAKEKAEAEQKKIRDAAAQMEREEKERVDAQAKAQKAAAARGALSATAAAKPLSQLWTSKHAPTQMNQICGNKGNVEKIQSWLKAWPKNKKYNFMKKGADGLGSYRAILISGPPGIGKTTAAHLAAKLEGYDVIETNASDARSQKLVNSGLTDAVNNTSLLGFFAADGKDVNAGKKQTVLIMDEVDGMSAGDRGGVGALAKFCKKTEVPLILICNDRRLPKMKPFDFVTFDIKFQRPTVEQIRSRIMTICLREGLKLPVPVVDALVEGSNRDIRQIINMISTAKLDQQALDFNKGKEMSKAWEKHIVLKPWDICQKLLGGGMFGPASKATLNDKIELYFNDHEFSYLMIQENYLRAKPSRLQGKGYNAREANLKYLDLVDQAAESISDGDLVDRMIHGPQQQWSLMPTHAIFSTVRPASAMSGALMGSTFTSWLGNNSKTGKLGRFVREIHSHMRLKASGDHTEIRQQYLPVLWYNLVKKLEVEGKDSVDEVISLMDSYYLTREDFDAIKELGVGPQDESWINIESQTKAAFTRTYNAMSHPVPFMKASNVVVTKKGAKEMPDLEEAIEEDDDAPDDAPEVVEDDDDLSKDKMIKVPKKKKAPAKKTPAKKKAAAAADDDDEDEKPAKTKTKAPAKPRGRSKKA